MDFEETYAPIKAGVRRPRGDRGGAKKKVVGLDSDDEDVADMESVPHSPTASSQAVGPVSLRQMTLLELFHPIEPS